MIKCRHCGNTDDIYGTCDIKGTAQIVIDEHGNETLDSLDTDESNQTYICGKCNKQANTLEELVIIVE